MIRLRPSATAFLMNSGDVLLMKRSITREFAPGIWAGVGGHLEPDEINDPQVACRREILEETGLDEEHVTNLRLKSIILRRSQDEIRVQYVFFGDSSRRDVVDTDEGELHWISQNELLNRELSFTTRAALRNFLESGGQTDTILVGTVRPNPKCVFRREDALRQRRESGPALAGAGLFG
ncbi:MAG: NUDIX domain-containing protein [Bacillota bacterium]